VGGANLHFSKLLQQTIGSIVVVSFAPISNQVFQVLKNPIELEPTLVPCRHVLVDAVQRELDVIETNTGPSLEADDFVLAVISFKP